MAQGRAMARRGFLAGALLAGLAARGIAQTRPGGKPPATAPAPDPRIAALVGQVSRERLRRTVQTLSGLPTRWTESPEFPRVEALVAAAFGPDAAPERQAFALPSGPLRHNLIIGDPRDPRGVVLVGAHYDSLSEVPARRAPGANDNASGMAALIEIHHLLQGRAGGRALVCAAFAGEEQGFLGSTAMAERARAEGWRIDLMLNLDMLGYRPPDPAHPLVIEYDQGNATAANDTLARRWGLRAAALAALHTTLPTRHGDIWGSDYIPFEAQGFPCIGLYDDGGEGGLYHTTRDLPEFMDFDRLAQATRLALAIAADATG